MSYFKKYLKYMVLLGIVIFGYNLYFLYLVPEVNREYLYYLDFLVVLILLLFGVKEWWKYREKEKKKKDFLTYKDVAYPHMKHLDEEEIFRHDIEILKKQYKEQFDSNCELQDYIAKWCHEVKIPLTAALLINDRIEDPKQKKQLKEQLEKIRQQLNMTLVGCKVQSSIYDLKIEKNALKECVNTSIKNNRFFLIERHFEVLMEVGDEDIYTDREWIVYVLDQLIGNAIKYAGKVKKLQIKSEKKDGTVILYVKDFGEGIQDCDIRRIYEKGFTGQNHHNGQYRSTGMGLYMVSLILKRLGHKICVESEYGKFTCFSIIFEDHREYFNL